jgi:hypothetical protein
MFDADCFEETLNFDWYQNNEYNWNSDRSGAGAIETVADEPEPEIDFGDRAARFWQPIGSPSADEILLFQHDGLDLGTDEIASAEAEKMTDFDILTGEAIARSGDGDTRNSADGQTAIKTATAPDLTRRGRPKRQGEAGSYFADPAPAPSGVRSEG